MFQFHPATSPRCRTISVRARLSSVRILFLTIERFSVLRIFSFCSFPTGHKPFPGVKRQMCEEARSQCNKMDEVTVTEADVDVGNSDLPRENAVVRDGDNNGVEQAKTIQDSCKTGELVTAVADCAGIDDGEAEADEGTSLDREALNTNDVVAGNHERPGGDECAVEIQSRVESGESVVHESADTLCGSADLEDLTATTDTLVNKANETTESVCIEVEDITEDNDDISKNSDTISTRTTIIYVSEGDNSDLETDVCRICHSGDEAESLISPCLCTGSVKFVHHTCLMSWLQRAVMSKCELCLYPLAVKRKRKPLSKVSTSRVL